MSPRSARIRIVLKREAGEAERLPRGDDYDYPIIEPLPDWANVQIIVVTANGEEFELRNVRGLKLEMSAATMNQPVEATLRVMIDELDVECCARIEALPKHVEVGS